MFCFVFCSQWQNRFSHDIGHFKILNKQTTTCDKNGDFLSEFQHSFGIAIYRERFTHEISEKLSLKFSWNILDPILHGALSSRGDTVESVQLIWDDSNWVELIELNACWVEMKYEKNEFNLEIVAPLIIVFPTFFAQHIFYFSCMQTTKKIKYEVDEAKQFTSLRYTIYAIDYISIV